MCAAPRVNSKLESPWKRRRTSRSPWKRRRTLGPAPLEGPVYRNRRSRRLLRMTNTEENAIAAPAIIGLSSPAAAIGIAAVL